jgi:hypothetical protein
VILLPIVEELQFVIVVVKEGRVLISFVSSHARGGKPDVVESEQGEHNTHGYAQDRHEGEEGFAVKKISIHNIGTRLHRHLGLKVHETGIPQVMLLDQALEDKNADNCTIGADNRMAEDEEDEPSVVVEAYTVVDPNAMVVKLFYAHIAHPAVLRPRRLLEFTRLALILLHVHNIIEVISFQCPLMSRLANNTGITRACDKEGVVTEEH